MLPKLLYEAKSIAFRLIAFLYEVIAFLYFAASVISLMWVDVVDAIKTASIFLSLNAIDGLSIGFDLRIFAVFRVNFLFKSWFVD